MLRLAIYLQIKADENCRVVPIFSKAPCQTKLVIQECVTDNRLGYIIVLEHVLHKQLHNMIDPNLLLHRNEVGFLAEYINDGPNPIIPCGESWVNQR